MVFSPYSYWSFLGLFYLLVLTWQDLRHKMDVDDRRNYFMMGLTFGLYFHLRPPTVYILTLIGLVIALRFGLGRLQPLGVADLNTLVWTFIGFGIIGLNVLLLWVLLFCGFTLLFLLIKHAVFKIEEPTPFYPVLTLCFALTAGLFGLF